MPARDEPRFPVWLTKEQMLLVRDIFSASYVAAMELEDERSLTLGPALLFWQNELKNVGHDPEDG